LRAGVLQQCADPQVLYDRPDNLFVAAFIGSPAMNLYEATIGEGARSVQLGSQRVELPDSVALAHPALSAYAGKPVVIGIRPEHLPNVAPGGSGPELVADVDLVEALGSELVVHFTIDAKRVQAEGAHSADAEAATISGEGVARVDPKTAVKAGDRITFAIETSGLQFFDPDSGAAIWH
jgi:multiple sugar transport system ATP-binding protein